MTTTTAPQLQVKRKPIRGAIYGLLAGLGIAVELVILAMVKYSTTTIIVITVIGAVLGLIWGLVAPAKKADGVPGSSAAFGTTFTRSADVDHGPAPTYEEEYGSAAPTPPAAPPPAASPDDGAFGAPDDGGDGSGGGDGDGD
jgi:hypothetical protein